MYWKVALVADYILCASVSTTEKELSSRKTRRKTIIWKQTKYPRFLSVRLLTTTINPYKTAYIVFCSVEPAMPGSLCKVGAISVTFYME